MAQYPNEKDPRSNWVYPPQQDTYPPPPQPPPAPNPPYSYASRDGAPSQRAGYAAVALQGPPPDYGYAQGHPDQGTSALDHGGHGFHNAPEAGPPASSSSSSTTQEGNGSGGIMMSLAAFFGNKGPPPMWQRPAPLQLPYPAFPPMCLISNSKDLSSGFPDLPPPCALNPHPFATHDVTEEDWKRFLTDMKKAGSLSPAQRIRSNVIPMVTGMSFVTGFFATFAIEKRMKYKNRQAAGDLVDHWNHYFFGPRRMEVVLCQASERLSGKLGVAPVADAQQQRMANGLRRRGDDSSSSSDSEDEHKHGQGHQSLDRQGRRAARRERREARRARRGERRERKARGEHKEPYQLIVTAV